MSEIKPVYQVYNSDYFGRKLWVDADKKTYDEYVLSGDETRILYPAAAYEALQKRNEFLEYEVKHLKDALRAYDDEDIDDE